MQSLPGGSMLAVFLEEKELEPYLDDDLSLAVINSPSICVISGQHHAIQKLAEELDEKGIHSRSLHTSHAFHSKMMNPILDSFTKMVGEFKLREPKIPFVSNVTGTWIKPDEATDPGYWANHLRRTVRFYDCLHELSKGQSKVFLEVGPGNTLASLARQHPDLSESHVILSSIRHPKEQKSDLAFILNTLGQIWLTGVDINWSGFYKDERRNRIPLPTYPFERKRYWLSNGRMTNSLISSDDNLPISSYAASQVDDDARDLEIQSTKLETPKDDMEQSIALIWQRLLGVGEVKRGDNFFELGGSSLMAISLFAEIDRVFGKRLPLATLFDAPTIEQLAGRLKGHDTKATHSSLIKIQTGNSRPAFYCLPGNLGNVFSDLSSLSRHIGIDQPFFGLQDGLGHPSKVTALAAHYIEDIMTKQDKGPYYLGGICSGAVVVFEIAQQLQRLGKEVALLALIEPAALPLPGSRSYYHLFKDIWKRIGGRQRDLSKQNPRLNFDQMVMFLRLKRKLFANIWALKHYFPQAYPDHYHLFLTKESFSFGSRLKWIQFSLDKVEVHEIPGTHRSITGDNVPIEEDQMRELGEKLRTCIDNSLIE
jgi:thioesterase domain-containing protein/acyl carrier protein